MKNDYIIRLEKETDHFEVENLIRESFWNIYRPGCLEHYVIHCLRHDPAFIPQLDLVMEKDGKIIGQIIYMKAEIKADNGKIIPIVTAGPLCIDKNYQKQGYGKILLDYSMSLATKMGYGAMCFEGNYEFYKHSGFDLASKKKIHYYAEPRESIVPYFLLKELISDYLKGIEGTYTTPKGYFVDEKKAEEFDKQFPKKQKLKLPGQLV